MNAPLDCSSDPRLEHILDILLQLASGNMTVRTSPSDRGDALDAVMTGLNMLAEELSAEINNLERTQQELKQSEKKYHELVDKIDDGIIVVDTQGRVTFTNRAMATITGYHSTEQLLNQSIFDLVTAGDRQRVQDIFKRDIDTGRPTRLLDTSIVQPSGTVRFIQIKPSLVIEAGNVIGARAVIRDTTERHETEQEIAYRASHDSLTGLPNRSMVMQSLDYLLAQAKREHGYVAVLFLDLDEFKLVNDTLGHSAGDELLRQAALRLRNTIRASDVVARLGGDEFITLLASHCQQQTDDAEQIEGCISRHATTLAQRIIDTLKSPFHLNGQDAYVSASIGISLYPSDATDAATLLQFADSAMYRVKEMGRNGFHFYSEELTRRQTARLHLSNDLHRAIAEQEFLLMYQPIIDLDEGRMVGVEALIRWQTSDGQLLSPAQFIPVAESTGMILAIGNWVLAQACQQIRAWQQQGLELFVSVNLSARQLWQGDIIAQTLQIIEDSGIDHRLLELEVTERVMFQDPIRMEEVLQNLHDHHLDIALDDFGTGYSSLDRLKKLPISKLKIDRSFVEGIPDEPRDAAIVTSIIQLANNLQLQAVAEGVETAAQWRYLLAQGCPYGQGFYFSPPVTADEIEDMVGQAKQWELPGQRR
jgi:diguanylate cyclase (GGDEF)-like protein/PAS domain S-box-containing protein